METMIATLVERYDSGSLTRPELIRSLMLLAAGESGAGEAATAPSEESKLQVIDIDHVSLQVSDVRRSADFFQKAFNLPLLDEDKKVAHLKVGHQLIVLRQTQPYGVVDHIALGVEPFDKAAITQYLKQQGVTALDTAAPLTFHVIEPGGFPIQIVPYHRR